MKPAYGFSIRAILIGFAAHLLFITAGLGQTNYSESGEYSRSSFTIIHAKDETGGKLDFRSFLNGNSPYISRFDWNDLPTYRMQMERYAGTYNAQELTEKVNQSGIGRELLAFWFQRKPDGMFDTRMIASRGMYNASDMQKRLATSSPRDVAELQDAGFRLINNSYVVLFYVNTLMPMEEYYNLQDEIGREKAKTVPEYKFTPIARTKRGFAGTTTACFFKLDYNDRLKQDFYDLWIYEGDSEEEITRKKAAFEKLEVRFIYVDQFTPRNYVFANEDKDKAKNKTIDVSAGFQEIKPKTDEELLKEFEKDAVEVTMDYFINKSKAAGEAKLKSGIYKTRPIQAKIGVKEGVYPEKRFAVYEKREKADGSIVNRKKGVIRAKRGVVDNRFSKGSWTTPSKFFRVNGIGRIGEGMLLAEMPERGLSFGVMYAPGFSGGLIRDLTFNAEWNLSLTLGKTMGSRAITGLRSGGSYSIERYEILGNFEEKKFQTFERQMFYLKKEWPLVSIFRLGLSTGVSFCQSSSDVNAYERFSATFIPISGELGIAISPWLNTFLQTVYDIGIYDANQQINDQNIATGIRWYDLYPYRNEMTHRVGVRILL